MNRRRLDAYRDRKPLELRILLLAEACRVQLIRNEVVRLFRRN